jgi:phenylalanyl-tRNA synthetase beta chain
MTYGFASEAQLAQFGDLENSVKLANPLTSDMVYMRTSIVPALLTSLGHNIKRQVGDVKLFELNKVFLSSGKGLPRERLSLALVMTGSFNPEQWGAKERKIDFFDTKAALTVVFEKLGIVLPEVTPVEDLGFLHPAEAVRVIFEGNNIGYCGRLHPSLEKEYDFVDPTYIIEIDFDALKEAYLKKEVSYRPISKYPIVVRDVALLVNSEVTHKELLQSFNKYVNKLVQGVELFDIYSGKGITNGKKSMAYRLCFGSDDKTLSDDEVDRVFSDIVGKVTKEIGAEVR